MTWMQTESGLKFPLDVVSLEAIAFEDIAIALSRVPRFAGHSKWFYSVAQHSVLAAELCPNFSREALMHDASEAYIGDICRPLKIMLGSAYGDVEDRVMAGIWERFFLRDDCWPEVKHADNVLLATEARDLMGGRCVDNWHERYGKPLENRIEPWSMEYAHQRFCDMWESL